MVLLGELEHIVQPLNVHPHGQGDVSLPHRTQEGTEVDDAVDLLRHHDLLQILEVQDVCVDVGTCRGG